MENLEKMRAKTISEIMEPASATDRDRTAEKAQETPNPMTGDPDLLLSRLGQTSEAMQIAPNRWLVSIVIDEPTKDNLYTLCRRAGLHASQRIAQLINNTATARKRHK
mgnify:CR=1 FL=1